MGYLSKRKPPTSRLYPKDIVDIKNALETLIRSLAKTYDVKPVTIRNVLTGKSWQQIKIKKIS